MAYLPPAGFRQLTSNKRTDLVFGVQRPCLYDNTYNYNPIDGGRSRASYGGIKAINAFQVDVRHLPPSPVKAEDWETPQQIVYGDKICPVDKRCPILDNVCFMADDYNRYDIRVNQLEAIRKRYRDTHDVKIRCDAQSRWQNESMKVFAVNRQWEDRYGKKYFYKCCCPRNPPPIKRC